MVMAVMPADNYPVGFRFRPTDEELIAHYLRGKINGKKGGIEVIPEVDVCRCEPWDLPDKSIIKNSDPEWFFFSPSEKKYPNGHRANRATGKGYWKATGKDRTIKPKSNLIGMKKTLVFHLGRAPNGERTPWIMHEYRPTEKDLDGTRPGQCSFVLCRLFYKPDERAGSPTCKVMDEIFLKPSIDEVDPDDLSPAAIKPSRGDAEHRADDKKPSLPYTAISGTNVKDEIHSPYVLESQPLDVSMWLDDTMDIMISQPSISEMCRSENMHKVHEDLGDRGTNTLKLEGIQNLGMNSPLAYDSMCNNGVGVMHMTSDMVLGHPFVDPPFYEDFGAGQVVDYTSPSDDNAFISEFLDGILRNDEDVISNIEVVGPMKLVTPVAHQISQPAPSECGFTKDSGSSSSEVDGSVEPIQLYDDLDQLMMPAPYGLEDKISQNNSVVCNDHAASTEIVIQARQQHFTKPGRVMQGIAAKRIRLQTNFNTKPGPNLHCFHESSKNISEILECSAHPIFSCESITSNSLLVGSEEGNEVQSTDCSKMSKPELVDGISYQKHHGNVCAEENISDMQTPSLSKEIDQPSFKQDTLAVKVTFLAKAKLWVNKKKEKYLFCSATELKTLNTRWTLWNVLYQVCAGLMLIMPLLAFGMWMCIQS